MTRNGTVPHFRGPFTDGDGLGDWTARVFKDARVLRPAYAALGSQVLQQLLLQRSTRLSANEILSASIGISEVPGLGQNAQYENRFIATITPVSLAGTSATNPNNASFDLISRKSEIAGDATSATQQHVSPSR